MKPLLRKYSNSTMTLVMLGILVVMVAVASRYPPEARFMPFVVGIPAILLCLLQLVLDARARRRPPASADTRSDLERAQAAASQIVGHQVELGASGLPQPQPSSTERINRELVLWGYFLSFIAAIVLFGFWVAIPLFLVSFLRFQAKAGWLTTLLLGIGVSVALFLMFEWAFKAQVHRGFVTSFVLDQLSR